MSVLGSAALALRMCPFEKVILASVSPLYKDCIFHDVYVVWVIAEYDFLIYSRYVKQQLK